ncbi:MAG: hypothetical protein EPN86_03925 [Nanoarchaeota archaeon]|nr:MAG: hypothetical protein EPN86_03925 [Nanoarchaeota archaeon]
MKESLWKKLLSDFEKAEAQREKIVQISRETIQLSKRAIYAAHRLELKESRECISKMKPLVKQMIFLLRTASSDAKSSVKVALQEYVEAVCLCSVLEGRDLPSHVSLGVDAESYLLGLSDLVGELGRVGVHRIIKNDYKSALKMQAIVHDLYGKFMHLNLRNTELRKKVDGVKWELKKMEDVILQLKISGRIE